jgi:hypothetical protein
MSGQGDPASPRWPPAEVIAWRTSMEDKLLSLRDLIVTRIEAMDKAAEILADNLNRVPTLLDRETSRLTALFEERTCNIRHAMKDRDDQSRQDKATAVSAAETALTSLKELIFLQNSTNAAAISKSEASTANDLESLNRIITTTKDGLSNDINNLKQRLDRGEGAYTGHRDAAVETHSNIGSISLMIGCVVGIIGLALTGYSFVAQHSAVPLNPTVGADTKRVDDLIASGLQRDRDIQSRIDALSARLNSAPATTPSAPAIAPSR